MVGVVFVTGGWNHLKDPGERSKNIGMSKGFTLFLGAAELTGGLGVAFGVLTQLAAQFSKHKLREAFNPAIGDLQEHAEDSFMITITGALWVSEDIACDTPAHFSHSADDL